MRRWIPWLVILATAACGPREVVERPSVRSLLRNGQYEEAVAEAQRLVAEHPGQPHHVAVLAVAQAGLAAPAPEPADAIETLRQVATAASPGRAIDEFTSEALACRAFLEDRFTTASDVALGVATGWSPEQGDTDATRGAAALLALGTHGAEFGSDIDAVSRLVQQADRLVTEATEEYAFTDGDDYNAWVVYRSAGSLADAANRRRARELAWAGAEVALKVAEHNPRLAIPIACDLSSPIDRIRDVLRYDQGMLSRFENALTEASGCNPGTFAPASPDRAE